MFNLRFLIREMAEARNQAGIFILCVALSITSLVALNSFKGDVHQSIIGDARALHGGDIILHSHHEFSLGLLTAVNSKEQMLADRVHTWSFYSVVRNGVDDSTLFSNIKAVGSSYPLYGEVLLGSGENFQRELAPGTIVVGQGVLDKLNLKVGDFLHVGKAKLRIADVVLRESTRPVDVLSFGPRVFVAAADLQKIDLVKTGSRVEYELLLKLKSEEDITPLAAELKKAALPEQERVSTYATARSGLKRFFDNLLFFLSLISIFTLLLAGIGMQSSLSALLLQKEKTLAIAKALGATQRFIFTHYFILVMVYGGIGSFLGITAAFGLKHLFPALFSGLISADNIGGLGASDIVEGMALGFTVVCFFTFLPLYRLREVKPNVIFRSEAAGKDRGMVYYFAVASGFALLSALVIRQLDDVKTGLYFMAAMTALILLTGGLARLLLIALRKLSIRPLPMRQALRSLLRPGNSTQSVIVTLASSLSVLLAIFLVEYNLHSTYVESYPEDAPNLFLVDIQPSQKEGFVELVGGDVQLHPIIRARLKAINDKPVRRGEKRSRFRDNLTREFNLTYRDELLPDEQVIGGDTLFSPGSTAKIQVSLLDSVAEMGNMQIGDTLYFNIQGVPLQAEVTSIRSRNKSMLYPFFYFVFPTEFLEKAPQTLFAALHVEKEEIAALEKKVVKAFPNISLINMAETAVELGGVMKRLSGIVNFFALFSILAGALIIISSIFATRMARVREAVYYKVLGSRSRFIFSVFFYENIALGILSSVLGVALAQVGSWALCHFLFDISFRPNWSASLILIALSLLLVVGVGMTSSISIMQQKPMNFLREQTIE